MATDQKLPTDVFSKRTPSPDEEHLADFNNFVDGCIVGNMRGHCSLNKYLSFGQHWEQQVEQAERSWFSAESIAEEEARIADLRARLDARIAKSRSVLP